MIFVYLFVVFIVGFIFGLVGIGVLNDYVFIEFMGIKNLMSVFVFVIYLVVVI